LKQAATAAPHGSNWDSSYQREEQQAFGCAIMHGAIFECHPAQPLTCSLNPHPNHTLASDLAAAEVLPLPAMAWPLAEAEPVPVTLAVLLELAEELVGVLVAVACTRDRNRSCGCQEQFRYKATQLTHHSYTLVVQINITATDPQQSHKVCVP